MGLETAELYRLVSRLSALETSLQGVKESQVSAWNKIDDVQKTMQDVDKKLDRIIMTDEQKSVKIKDLQEGVTDYRSVKSRIVGIVCGIGMATGMVSGAITGFLSKLFGNS